MAAPRGQKLTLLDIIPHCHQDMTSLLYLYLTDNHIDYVPVPLPDSLRSLHLQVHLPSHVITANYWSMLYVKCTRFLCLFLFILFIYLKYRAKHIK